jgi:D-arginine dehydrogenase
MHNFDLIIIGSGICGAGLAAYLPDNKRILILEMEPQPGFHSTGRSAALYIRSYGNATIRALNELSLPFFNDPQVNSKDQSLLTQRGVLSICVHGQDEMFESFLQENPTLKEISVQQALDYVPLLRPETFSRAVYEPEAYDIDVAGMHQSWLKRAAENGSVLECKSEVLSLEKTADGWLVDTGSKTYHTKIIVNSAGAWADQVAGLATLAPMGLTPKRRSIVVTSLPDNNHSERWPLFCDAGDNWYAKPASGKLLISPADADPMPACDIYPDDMVIAEGIHRFESAVDLDVKRIENTWAGLRTFSPDNSPVVGFDPRSEGFFWLAGQGGYGIQTAPALSKIAAALLAGKSTHPVLETSLSPARFVDN